MGAVVGAENGAIVGAVRVVKADDGCAVRAELGAETGATVGSGSAIVVVDVPTGAVRVAVVWFPRLSVLF